MLCKTPAKMPYNPWFAAMGEDGEPAQKCIPTHRLYNRIRSLGACLERKGFFIVSGGYVLCCSCYLSFSDAKSCLECKKAKDEKENPWANIASAQP